MYPLFLRLFGPRLAPWLLPPVYVAMILAIGYCVFEQQAEFNYLRV
ncbi:MAG: hypothetical protein ACK40H_01860 [Sphingomonadaceae bacterium]|jgi:hypothetical protein